MFKKLFCKHNYWLYRVIYGDVAGSKRAVWKCSKCGKTKLSDYLDKLD